MYISLNASAFRYLVVAKLGCRDAKFGTNLLDVPLFVRVPVVNLQGDDVVDVGLLFDYGVAAALVQRVVGLNVVSWYKMNGIHVFGLI